MKIELNKAYINRICEVVWITEETPGSAYPFTGKTLNGDNLTYSETGKFSEHDQHPLDLTQQVFIGEPSPQCKPDALDPVRLQLICAALSGMVSRSVGFSYEEVAVFATSYADAVIRRLEKKS